MLHFLLPRGLSGSALGLSHRAIGGLVLSATLITGCSSQATHENVGAGDIVNSEVGMASYYADRYHGRTTASGERFDQEAMTAAHRTLAFGTRVRVTRLDNNRQVTVRINDRGPFRGGRIIDLSKQAARKLGMLRDGTVRVRLSVLR